MGDEQFTRGQRVSVEIGGRQVASIFVRDGAPQEAVGGERALPSSGAAARLAWVRRSDTGEVEPVDYSSISAA